MAKPPDTEPDRIVARAPLSVGLYRRFDTRLCGGSGLIAFKAMHFPSGSDKRRLQTTCGC
jgi:hypothetical protein